VLWDVPARAIATIDRGGLLTPALVVALTEAQRAELSRVRDTDPKAYRRQRAAAILKLAD